jgi:AcrR family transcriptional regulator
MGEAQSSLRERKKLETKQQILGVALSLLQEQGSDNTSFEEVAEEANGSRASALPVVPAYGLAPGRLNP